MVTDSRVVVIGGLWPLVFREIPNVLHVRDLIVARQTAAGTAS